MADVDRDADAQAVAAAAAGRRVNASGNVRVNCPLCPVYFGSVDRGQSLSVQPAKGAWKCWRCMHAGRLPGTYAPTQEVVAPTRHVFDPPDGFVPIDECRGSIAHAPSVEYLERRVGLARARALGFGSCMVGQLAGRVVMPLRDRADLPWWGWVARTVAGDVRPKYRYPPGMERRLFNPLALDLWDDAPALIVEGVFDALPYWPHAVACLGKPTDDHVAIMARSNRPIAVCLDGDAWREGEMLMLRIALCNDRVPVGVVKIPPKEDPGSIEPRALFDAARKAVDVRGLVEL